MSRGFRCSVAYGSIEYSAVIQPPETPCSFIQRGTPSSIIAAQITRVLPQAASTEPVACGAMCGVNSIVRNWSFARPSERVGILDFGFWILDLTCADVSV